MAGETAEQQKQKLRSKKQNKFHISVYNLTKTLLGPLLRQKLGFEAEQAVPSVSTPYIVLANHASRLDPLYLGLAFPHMYFALSNKFAGGFGHWLVRRFFGPITRTSSGERILNAVARGNNVCFFPEGEVSPDGVTGDIPQSVAEIVKRSGAALVTYRLEGAFFAMPAWARHRRRGNVGGYIVHEYAAEELGHMKSRDLAEHIRQDMWVDAYQVNEDCLSTFYGKGKAEGLETVLHRCPACDTEISLIAEGDHLRCPACGLDVVWNDFGCFESAGDSPAPFKTLRDWLRWQREQDAEKQEQKPE